MLAWGVYSQHSPGHLQSLTSVTKFKQFGWMAYSLTTKIPVTILTLLMHVHSLKRQGEALCCCQNSHWLQRSLWTACIGINYNVIDVSIFFASPTDGLNNSQLHGAQCCSVLSVCALSVYSLIFLVIGYVLCEKMYVWQHVDVWQRVKSVSCVSLMVSVWDLAHKTPKQNRAKRRVDIWTYIFQVVRNITSNESFFSAVAS